MIAHDTNMTWANAGNDTPSLAALRPTYLALHLLGGHIGLPLLVLIFLFSTRVSAHPTLVNFCITWILYSICYSLTAYDGNNLIYSVPTPKLCIAQAVMVEGVAPMAAVAGVAVTVQLWSMFHEPQFYSFDRHTAPYWSYLMLVLAPPYLAFLAFALASGIIIATHPDLVGAPSGLYCSVQVHAMQNAVAVFCSIMMAIITGLGVVIAVMFSRRWVHIQRAFPLAKRRPSISMCLRVAILCIYVYFTLGVCIMFVVKSNTTLPYMVEATLPFVAFLVFGTRKDIFHLCCFWRRRRKDSTGSEYPSLDSSRPSKAPLQSEEDILDFLKSELAASHV